MFKNLPFPPGDRLYNIAANRFSYHECGKSPTKSRVAQIYRIWTFFQWRVQSIRAGFFEELPQTFNPTRFEADEWARQENLSGFKYVVFTAMPHSGFCVFDSETTGFDITSTPYKNDILAEVIDAFRAQGWKVGLYFTYTLDQPPTSRGNARK